MSFSVSVFLSRERMLTPGVWQEAIQRANFPVKIDQEFDPASFTGFLPCQYKGSTSGFEYFSRELTNEEAADLGVPGYDYSVQFVVHSGHNEFQTALAAASSLCATSDGVLYDPQSGETVASDIAVAWATKSIRECPEDAQ